jgi:hypothetical protein
MLAWISNRISTYVLLNEISYLEFDEALQEMEISAEEAAEIKRIATMTSSKAKLSLTQFLKLVSSAEESMK